MTSANKLVRLDPDKLAGLDLEEMAPYPDDIVLTGKSEHQRWPFTHDELFVGAYQASPAKLVLEDYPYDEFMDLPAKKVLIALRGCPARQPGSLAWCILHPHSAPCREARDPSTRERA